MLYHFIIFNSKDIDIGLTYIPSPDPKLEYREVGSFQMGIFGVKDWESKDFDLWPFAIPVTELNILTSDINTLDMWPTMAPRRYIKYKFELLETDLQTSRQGLSVLHCPDFIIRLHNEQVELAFHLVKLPIPKGYKSQSPVKIYLVAKKGSGSLKIEGKLAKFIRLIK